MDKSDRFKIYPTCKKCSQFFESDLLFEFHKLGTRYITSEILVACKTLFEDLLTRGKTRTLWYLIKRMFRHKTDMSQMRSYISWRDIGKYTLCKTLS